MASVTEEYLKLHPLLKTIIRTYRRDTPCPSPRPSTTPRKVSMKETELRRPLSTPSATGVVPSKYLDPKPKKPHGSDGFFKVQSKDKYLLQSSTRVIHPQPKRHYQANLLDKLKNVPKVLAEHPRTVMTSHMKTRAQLKDCERDYLVLQGGGENQSVKKGKKIYNRF